MRVDLFESSVIDSNTTSFCLSRHECVLVCLQYCNGGDLADYLQGMCLICLSSVPLRVGLQAVCVCVFNIVIKTSNE